MFDETFAESWKLRFGAEPSLKIEPLAPFMRHRSVRRFKPEPIPEGIMASLVACAQSAATSSNLQLYSMISVQDRDRREAIAKLCADQDQVRNASWFFAFCADHHRLRQAALRAGQGPAGLDYTEFLIMSLLDAALAAERMVCAAETLGIGICYIGALRNHAKEVARLLELPDGVFGAFGLCLGYPEEPLAAEVKPRLRTEAVWHRERYDPTIEVSDYDSRMSTFYEKQGMKGEVTWSMRSGRRVDGSERSLTGRGVLKEWLEERGFGRR